jgi:hypothetical protein
MTLSVSVGWVVGINALPDRFLKPIVAFVGCPPDGKNFLPAKGISCVQNRSLHRLDGPFADS